MTKPLIFLCILLGIGLEALTQEASLRGTIRSADHPQGLQGVNIMVESTGAGAISGLHGHYRLEGIPAGTQTLVFSFVGYATEQRSVQFEAGESVELDVKLSEGAIDLASVSVEARRPFSAASSSAIRDFDLKVKPVRSAQDILQLVPGLMIAQHAGGGKAEQIFLRGFDADHGTDVGLYVDGMPVNMVTHGHGQGYADLHFIIPELIEGVEVYKGPYFSQFGNFGTAGSVQMRTTDHPEHNLVKMEGGMFQTAKATTVLKIPTNGMHQSAYVAGQYYHSNGPVEDPQGFMRANFLGKFHTHLSPKSELGISLGAFASAWNASGQIPERAVEDGIITRWGSIDPLEGGSTSRKNFSVDYHFMEGDDHDFQLQAYMTQYDFKLYSNFTFWLDDPVDGDMIEQNDHRRIYGIQARYGFRKNLGRIRSHTRAGGGMRSDHIDLSLWKSPDRNRMFAYTSHSVAETNLDFWISQDLVFSRQFKIQAGLRGDYFLFDVVDHLEQEGATDPDLVRASGYAQKALLSPSLNVVWSPLRDLDIFLNGGTGFHSNDARDVIVAQGMNLDIETLPRALGSELGLRAGLGRRMIATFAAWYLHLEEELVFVGDAGTTEISGETRRIGLDAELRFQLAAFLWGDVDVNISDGRYLREAEGANHIPLAPRVTSQGGLNMQHPSGLEASLRYRYIGDRPANEDNSVVASGYFLANVVLAYSWKQFRVFAQVENLLNTTWNEAQFDTESRLFNESLPVSEIHYTPGNPLNLQAGISFEF